MANQITYRGWTFSGAQIREGNPYDEVSLPSSALGSSTITVTVKCTDPSITNFQRNEPLIYTRDGRRPARYFVQSIQRVRPDHYKISASSMVGLLERMSHRGGIYTGQTVDEVVRDICGTLPVHIKTDLAKIALYGWLPYVKPPDSSARDNLAQVLFAIGAYLGVDLEGYLRVEPLWDGVTNTVTRDRIYVEASVSYDPPVTTVVVDEHQYLVGAEADRTTLFEGEATAGTLIRFDDPMSDLEATGFAIQESGPNYAVLSAGSGTLTGIPYLHTIRQVSQPVTDGAAENVKTISDATLVSFVNSAAVATRMAAYYRCVVSIAAPILAVAERAGHIVSIYDPFEGEMVNACISSMDITMSAKLRAETAALVGFKPPQPGTIPYYDTREILSGSGTWTVPEGVTNVGYVLFSGAQGGAAGKQGGTASENATHNYSYRSTVTGQVTSEGRVVLWGGPGGTGGLGGAGGRGAKIYQGSLSVTPGQTISYACGTGGEGADYDADNPDATGAEGTATTFGDYSSDSGSYPSSTGWEDITTGEIYATVGLDGLPGGNGAGRPEDYEIPDNTNDLDQILVYQPSTAAMDEDGVSWPGATTKEGVEDDPGTPGVAWRPDHYTTAYQDGVSIFGSASGYGLGPGGVAGVTQAQPSTRNPQSSTAAVAVDGLTPPAPALIPSKPGPTKGGRGGYGGGGGSCASWAGGERDPRYTDHPIPTTTGGTPGQGGPGGKGGPGGDGLIILYYQRPGEATLVEAAVTNDQKWRLDKYGRRCIV